MAAAVIAPVGTAIQALGLLLHIIGLATPEWSTTASNPSRGERVIGGLWISCTSDSCRDVTCEEKAFFDGKFEAVEALAIIGMLAAIVAVVAAGLFVLLPMLGKELTAPLHLLSGCPAIFSFISIISAVIIWAAGVHAKVKDAPTFENTDLGYSFALSMAGGILLLVGGCMTAIGGRQTVVQMGR